VRLGIGSAALTLAAAVGAVVLSTPSTAHAETSAPGLPADAWCGAPLEPDLVALLQRAVAPSKAAGDLHQEVTASSLEAAAYYDQGLAYATSYVWVEAARAFHEALRRDPALAMGHLGLARVLWNLDGVEAARAHLARARELAADPRVTEKERRWIAAFEEQIGAVTAPDAEREARHLAYRKSLDALIALDPADPHAWVLRGNAEEPGAWGRGQAGSVGSIAYYETALRRDPDHLGAHHYLVHAYENLGRYAEAAEHARRYAARASGVAHAQHMYGHVLPRLGRWAEALRQFEQADRLERAYYAAEGIEPERDWHHGHNLHVLGVVRLRLGDEAGAVRSFQDAFALSIDSPRGGLNCGAWIEHLLLRGRYPEAESAAAACEERGPIGALVGAALRAEALAALGRGREAREAAERARASLPGFVVAYRATPLVAFERRFARLCDEADALVALYGSEGDAAETALMRVADELVTARSIDGWAAGIYRLVRFAEHARRAGRAHFAAALAQRIRAIDPAFPLPEAIAAAS
jgi:tetratricopeptide (TPR) repeat protein